MENWDALLSIGRNRELGTFSDAIDHIPVNARRIIISVCSNFVQDVDISFPTNRNLQLVKITSNNSIRHEIDFMGCSFFANGIPLEIDTSIHMKNCFLFGGGKAEKAKWITYPSSHLIIRGKVDYLFGGGYSIGSGSISTVKTPIIELIEGEVSHLFGNGYAVHQGHVNSDAINIHADAKSVISEELDGGNYLSGPDCRSVINEIIINLDGQIRGDVFLGGLAAYGSSTIIQKCVQLNAEKAKFFGKIHDGKTFGDECSVCMEKVTGTIPSEYRNALQIQKSNIQFASPGITDESTGRPETITGSPVRTTHPGNSDTARSYSDPPRVDYDEERHSGYSPEKRKEGNKIPLGLLCALIVFVFIIQSCGKSSNNNSKISSPTVVSTRTQKAQRVLTKTPTKIPTKINTIIPSKTSLPSSADYVGKEISMKTAETPILIAFETPAATIVFTESIEPTMNSDNTDIINNEFDSGALFYQSPNELVLRSLKNGTIIEIISGPVYHNNYEWYEIYCPQYNQTGWVISSSIELRSK